MRKEKPQILLSFTRYLVIQNYSVGTIKEYTLDLLLFFKFIIQYLNLNIKVKDINVFILINVKKQDILAFSTYLCINRENCFSTRKRKMAAIKKFYDWLYQKYDDYKIKENPTKGLPTIEAAERLPKYLKFNEAKRLKNIFNISNSRYYIRNNAIISLFLTTAMRLSELANIKIRDINFNDKTIKIIGKGNKERIIYLTDNLINILKEYLQTRKILNLNEYLFLNNKNQKLSNRSIEFICEKAFELAGLSKLGYTTHTLRHTAATYIYKATKDILVVKEILGHEKITTTMIYTHTGNEELKKAVDSNPLNQFQIENKFNKKEKIIGERKCIV